VKHTPPDIVAPTPEQRAALERFRDEHAGDRPGNVADHILYEDDDVRVWEMTLEPGEWTDLHHHEHDYILAIDSGDVVAGIPPKDSGMDFFIGRIPPAGNTVRVPKGGTEWALNIGKQRYHEILIELKKT
jgi:mannose-6-phosphate isomerase-like protein (cupin superfamily)